MQSNETKAQPVSLKPVLVSDWQKAGLQKITSQDI